MAAMLLASACAWLGPARAQGTAEAAQRRIALVIGNNAYDSAPLANSVNDAGAMADVLRDAGFAVVLLTDVDQRQFQLALREFGQRLKAAGSGGAGLFYYAGHGMQINGRNFLIPVRSHIVHEDEVAYAAVDAQAVLDKMESAGNGTNIVILDACRNNPFTRSWRSGQQGLAQMDAPVGTLVAYATAPGAVALDSLPGLRNGLYTTHLLQAIRRPGLKVEEVMKQVRSAVLRASGNKQMPWEASALVGDFYFHPPREAALAPAAAAPAPQSPAAAPAPPGAAAAPESGPSPPGLPAPPPRQALGQLTPAGSGITAPMPPDAAEEAMRWGQGPLGQRPENPRRNAAGFAEGDRFRYRKTDHLGGQGVTDYLWTVDRIQADGSVWLNGGRQRLDSAGLRLGGNDEHTGIWIDYAPPLRLLDWARRGAGVEEAFTTTVSVRDIEGRIERIAFAGVVRTHTDATRGPRGMADLVRAVRIEVALAGEGLRSDGARRQWQWTHTYWMALPLLLPVAMEVVEVADALPHQHTRHELVAIDQLSLSEAPARSTR